MNSAMKSPNDSALPDVWVVVDDLGLRDVYTDPAQAEKDFHARTRPTRYDRYVPASRLAEVERERHDERVNVGNLEMNLRDVQAHARKLEAAIHDEAISPPYEAINGLLHRMCRRCRRRWEADQPEKHAPGCLAALTPDGGRNDQ